MLTVLQQLAADDVVALTVNRIGELTRLGEATVRGALRELVAVGSVEVEAQRDEHGATTHNRYRLVPGGMGAGKGPASPEPPGAVNYTTEPRLNGCGFPPAPAVEQPAPAPPGREETGGIFYAGPSAIGEQFELVPAPAVFDQYEGFETFWNAWRRKVSKSEARKAWAKKRRDGLMPPLGIVLEALERWQASEDWTKQGGAFQPYPATWINGERWADEPPPPARRRRGAAIDTGRRQALATVGSTWNPDNGEEGVEP